MNKRILWTAFQYLLAFALLAWVIWNSWGTPGSNGLGDVWARHIAPPTGVPREPIHWEFVVMGFTIYAAAVFLTLVRWYVLVRAQDLPLSLPDALRLGLVGCFYNAFLPGSVGGDLVKAAVLVRGQERRTVAVATVLMDRFLALWGLVWLVAVIGSGLWLAGALRGEAEGAAATIITASLVVLGASLAVWLVMGLLPDERAARFAGRLQRLPKVGGHAAEMWRAVWLYRRRQKSVWTAMFLTWVTHVGFVVAFYCAANALYDRTHAPPIPSLAQHFLIVPLGTVVGALPLLPGGIGITEYSYGGLYMLFRCAKQNGTLAQLVNRIMSITVGLLGFVIYRWQVRGRVETAAERGAPVPEAATNGAAAALGKDGIAKGSRFFDPQSAVRNPQ